MKQFAFPLSVKCANVKELNECTKLLESIGYKYGSKLPKFDSWLLVMTNLGGVCSEYSMLDNSSSYANGRHHIDHFNPSLIRDIAAACTNDTWQKDELWVSTLGKLSIVTGYAGFDVDPNGHRRPTLAEICAHHGYEIKGRDIVKKVETVSNCDKSYCPIGLKLAEKSEDQRILIEQMDELKSKNDNLKEKLEAMTDADNHELDRLQRKVDELANKLQRNDNQHKEELESLYNKVVKLSREKQELIVRINTLTAFNDAFHTSRPLEFHPTNLPNMFQTKPAEFSEREKKRLLRLAERIERLIK